MKKKLEAELISIAHRILKLKNRAELDQLQQETLKLYEKLTVLKFVEDNFSDVKPTIGFASAEQKLEDIYGIEETPEVKANEVEAKEDEARAEKAEKTEKQPEQPEKTQAETEEKAEEPKAEEKTEEPKAEETVAPDEESKPAEEAEPVAETTEKTEATEEAAETEQPETETEDASAKEEAEQPEEEAAENIAQEETEKEAEPAKEVQPAEIKIDADVKVHEPEQEPVTETPSLPEVEGKPEGDGQDKDNTSGEGVENPNGKPAVSEEEQKSTEEAANKWGFDLSFDKKETEEKPKQKEFSFGEWETYKEPEFVKKDSDGKTEPAKEEKANALDDWMNWQPKKSAEDAPKGESVHEVKETPKEEPKAAPQPDDWMNWEPKKAEESPAAASWATETPKEEVKKEEPKSAPAAPRAASGIVRAISLSLNDRIAFEKHLFGGSSEDLNRVVSQLNTINSFEEAKDFIADLVKPDYSNWNGKEEYEERFMQLVEKKYE